MIPEKKEKKKRRDDTPTFARATSLFHAEIDPSPRGVHMTVGGVVHVSDFSPNLLSLVTEKGGIEISGSSLRLVVFENHIVGIFGHVEEIKLQYGKR